MGDTAIRRPDVWAKSCAKAGEEAAQSPYPRGRMATTQPHSFTGPPSVALIRARRRAKRRAATAAGPTSARCRARLPGLPPNALGPMPRGTSLSDESVRRHRPDEGSPSIADRPWRPRNMTICGAPPPQHQFTAFPWASARSRLKQLAHAPVRRESDQPSIECHCAKAPRTLPCAARAARQVA